MHLADRLDTGGHFFQNDTGFSRGQRLAGLVQSRGLQARIARDQGQVVGDTVLGFAKSVVRPDMANSRITDVSAFDIHGSGAFNRTAGQLVTFMEPYKKQKCDFLFDI